VTVGFPRDSATTVRGALGADWPGDYPPWGWPKRPRTFPGAGPRSYPQGIRGAHELRAYRPEDRGARWALSAHRLAHSRPSGVAKRRRDAELARPPHMKTGQAGRGWWGAGRPGATAHLRERQPPVAYEIFVSVCPPSILFPLTVLTEATISRASLREVMRSLEARWSVDPVAGDGLEVACCAGVRQASIGAS
jgi:hypothetical protein